MQNSSEIEDFNSIFKFISLDNEVSWIYFESMIEYRILFGAKASILNDMFESSPYIVNDITPNSIGRSIKYNLLAARIKNNIHTFDEKFKNTEHYIRIADRFLKN